MLPEVPILVCTAKKAVWISAYGEIENISISEVKKRIKHQAPPIVCHAPETARRLGVPAFDAFDVLELYAFVRPARFVLPTPRGLAEALTLSLPGNLEREAESLLAATSALLAELSERVQELGDVQAAPTARAMAISGWPWAQVVLAALGENYSTNPFFSAKDTEALKVWNYLPDWEEVIPKSSSGKKSINDRETNERLLSLLGKTSERRVEQVSYSISCNNSFQAYDESGEPRIVLAEAGTGVGKTLGYIAPASLWSEKNNGTVWISTFTKNLQRQLDFELDRLCPDAEEKNRRVVIRKGRENYFCLLNYDEVLNQNPTVSFSNWTSLGLMARWALQTRDGDMRGGDFPGWLKDLMSPNLITNLTDTRGECIYSSCRHYKRCFIEHSVRRAESADIVVANHALVMIQAAHNSFGSNKDISERKMPLRYIFDEGHHLFNAADNAFSTHLTARETAELRRWLIGSDSVNQTRSKGLKERIKDLISGDEETIKLIDEIIKAAQILPAFGWINRLKKDDAIGLSETFFALIRTQVYFQDTKEPSGYSLEAKASLSIDGLEEAAVKLIGALSKINEPLKKLISSLAKKLKKEAESLDVQVRIRIENVCHSLDRRGRQSIETWCQMLNDLSGKTPEGFVDWFGVERINGRDLNVGLHRHWIDPTNPFMDNVIKPAHGVVITSATLRDVTGDKEIDWKIAEQRTGTVHLKSSATLASESSPFDYMNHTRVMIVEDVSRKNIDATAEAYRELFLTAGGGSIGLFTAISRLRDVAKRISIPLEEAGLKLLAQHVDNLDTGTLVDIFRAEEHSCLLGTDAVRDGIDVPGYSLRLIVFDRVPWPRPDILHKHRRSYFGGKSYDDMLTRAKLKQAYGRLIRQTKDRGVFVILDNSMPSRLLSSFPKGVQVTRNRLKDAIIQTRAFLSLRD